ncbi:MAG: Lrp/AsnC ligand binding domain-containing protein [Chloroflexota bacterium]
MRAYILIDTAVRSDVNAIVSALQATPGATSADAVTGPHDIILTLETGGLDELFEIIAEHVESVPGVVSTITCLAFQG